MPYICANADSYNDKKYHGESQECVALVKKACNAPQTSQWKKGIIVKGNNITKGTAIATFEGENNKYEGHAAIYISQNNQGIQVIDQWKGHPSQTRIIYFDNSKTTSNNGYKFHIIE